MNTNSIIKLPVAELKTAIGGLTKVVARHSTLPVLGMIHVERDRQGWVHLTATDLDTFLSLRLEAPAQIGSPSQCLVPFAELQKLAKSCPADEALDLKVLAEDSVVIQDTGFQGYEAPGAKTLQPRKKPRGGELLPAEKKRNQLLSHSRAGVEHVISGIKRCRIVFDAFRNRRQGFVDAVMEVASGLHNLRVTTRGCTLA